MLSSTRQTNRILPTFGKTTCRPAHISQARHLCQGSTTTTESSPPPPPSQPRSIFRSPTFLLTSAAILGGAAYTLANPTGAEAHSKAIWEAIDSRIRFFAEPSREKLLPDIAPGFNGAPSPRTLVIDLDKTLVWSTYSRAMGWRVAKRPGAEAFLAYLANFYEIVIFTSSLNTYADPILDRLDPNGYITHRLYRAETHYRKGVHIKNLDVLNRDLSKVVVIDHDEKCVSMHKENAVIVPEWKGDTSDRALLDLIPFLESLVRQDVRDVREELVVLKEGELADKVQEYCKVVKKREEEGAGAGGGLFGRKEENIGVVVEEERERRGVWGKVGGGRIFQGKGAEQT